MFGLRSLRPFAFAALLGVPALLATTSGANADFRVCNEADDTVGVAIGYRGAEGWISEGWWHVGAKSCETLVKGTLTSRFYYLYAENAERSRRWGGKVRMCTAEDEFKVVDVKDCIARGYARMGFGEYDTGDQSSWTVRLTVEGQEPSQTSNVTDTAPVTKALAK